MKENIIEWDWRDIAPVNHIHKLLNHKGNKGKVLWHVSFCCILVLAKDKKEARKIMTDNRDGIFREKDFTRFTR